jgi:large subunit ribosomal protein L29
VKIEEVKTKTDDELTFELDKMKKELFELRFKSRTAASSNPARIKVLKRAIARVHTVRALRARESKPQPKAKRAERKR